MSFIAGFIFTLRTLFVTCLCPEHSGSSKIKDRKEKNYKNALSEFEAVLLANPENEDVKSKIEKLEKIVNKEAIPIPTPEPEEEPEETEEE